MPNLRLKGIETTDSTLDLLEEKLGLGLYQVIEELEIAAQEKLNELKLKAEFKIIN